MARPSSRRILLVVLLGAALGAVLPLWCTWITMYRTGSIPNGTVERTGTAQVSSCRRGWTTMQHCRSRVTWSDATQQQVIVLSHHALSGTVPVTMYRDDPGGRRPDWHITIPTDARHGNRLGGWIMILGIGLTIVGMFGGALGMGKLAARRSNTGTAQGGA